VGVGEGVGEGEEGDLCASARFGATLSKVSSPVRVSPIGLIFRALTGDSGFALLRIEVAPRAGGGAGAALLAPPRDGSPTPPTGSRRPPREERAVRGGFPARLIKSHERGGQHEG